MIGWFMNAALFTVPGGAYALLESWVFDMLIPYGDTEKSMGAAAVGEAYYERPLKAFMGG